MDYQSTTPSTAEVPQGAPLPPEPKWEVVKTYPYTDADGVLLYEKIREERVRNGEREKRFSQRRPDPSGNGYVNNLKDVQQVPYRLLDLTGHGEQDIHDTEGEKDADALAALGLCATSVATPNKVELGVFRDRHVFVHEDNDGEGRRKSKELATALVGIAASVRIVRYTDLHEGGDVCDYLAQGHGLEDVLARCDEAGEFKPPKEKHANGHDQSNGSRASFDTCSSLKRGVASARKALDNICAELRQMKHGDGRNLALNAAVFALGKMGARGWIDEGVVFDAVREACGSNGNHLMVEDRGKTENTLHRAWRDGLREPHADLLDRPYNGSGNGVSHARRTNGAGHNGTYVNGHDDTNDCSEVREPETDSDDSGIKPWPIINSKAAHGIVGELAKLATANSEADPIAVMATTLGYAAAEFGRNRVCYVGDTAHHARLNLALVGASSRSRKGTSYAPVQRVFKEAEGILQSRSTLPFPSGRPLNVKHGLSTGEGLIAEIRDRRDDEDEGGVDDKRLLVVEGEFGAVLRHFQRQGNTLSTTLRTAWDGWDLGTMTKNSPDKATDPHVCIIGHITIGELMLLLTSVDIANGVANRFLWVAVRRGKVIALATPMSDEDVRTIAEKLANVIEFAHGRKKTEAKLVMSDEAQDHWVKCYPELTQDYSGALGAITSRAEAQALRLAMTYAQLDGAQKITKDHLEAALVFWRYCFDSAAYVFGNVEIDSAAQKIVEALASGSKTQNEIVDLFGRHRSKAELDGVLTSLQDRGRITLTIEKTRGRPRSVWSLTE